MAKQWYQENLRFLQTVLRETDIQDYDAKAVTRYMKEVNANTLVINAGGIVDFFQNPLPMANPNRFMREGQDILKELCDALHAHGMRIIARVDFRGVDIERYESHPDWFAATQNGEARTSIGRTRVPLAAPCYNSYYANEHAVEFIQHLLSRYEIDGIWENALGFHVGPCYCKRCRDKYLADTGLEIPRLENAGEQITFWDLGDYTSPRFDAYREWKAGYADEHIARLRGAVKAFGEEKAYCAEIFDPFNCEFSKATGIDHANAKRHFDFLISCVFIDASHSPKLGRVYDQINTAGTTIKLSRALQPEKQPVICTGGNGTKWRYIKAPAVETRLWMWEIVAEGGGIWNCYFNGRHPGLTHDRRAAASERDAYTYLADNAALLSDTVPVRDASIYYSKATRDLFANAEEAMDSYNTAIRGAERVLLEEHIPYGFSPAEGITAESLNGIKVLLLTNSAALSDAEIEVIREYVKNGGGLVASFESSLYDAYGKSRENYGLADVFGVDYAGVTVATPNDCYQLVADAGNPVLKDIGDTEMLINGGRTALCTVPEASSAQVAATYIPIIPNQPPEFAWRRELKTDYATVISNTYGKGRVVFFANTLDALCHTNGHDDYLLLYRNALLYAMGEAGVIAKAPRSVHLHLLTRQDDSNRFVLSLVNTTGATVRPIQEIVPVTGVEIVIPIGDKKLASSKVLWGNTDVIVRDDAVVLHTGRLDEFMSIELKLM